MALEIKVYREITAYQSKVMMGMSWRQMACAAVGLAVVGSTYAACLWAGQSDLGSWLAALLTMPFIAMGWVRPKGLPFEKYARYFWLYKWEPQRRVYGMTPLLSPELEIERSTHAIRNQKAPKRANVRRLELDR
ncbi:PrgI family protein [Actinomyces howellii]|uniref:PrgI family protein n=1 Tax=Actinomyces howellii TaxID=52771 RepID=UPI000F817049|nr:PrgI family protein [Actinomyces howellii]